MVQIPVPSDTAAPASHGHPVPRRRCAVTRDAASNAKEALVDTITDSSTSARVAVSDTAFMGFDGG